MSKKARYAMGIFVEGGYLHSVCMMEKDGVVRLVEAEVTRLSGALETANIGNELVPEFSETFDDGIDEMDFAEDISNPDVLLSDFENELHTEENTSLSTLLERYREKKYSIGVSLTEPQIYYAYFNSDWGLKNTKLKKRVIEELAKLRPDTESLKLEHIQLTTLQDGRLLATIRDGEMGILSDLNIADAQAHEHISFVETAEFSLVNLLKSAHVFEEDGIKLVVYIGHEFSRLIFMQGMEIVNISYQIGAGTDSGSIDNTIYSRILLEQDNLNLPELNAIILTGQAVDSGLDAFLREKFSDGTTIETLHLNMLGLERNDPRSSQFAVPIGAALRALDPTDKKIYKIDLTPTSVKESRKKFKLGILGWLLLGLIPLSAYYITVQYHQQSNGVKVLESMIRSRKVDLDQLQEIEMRLNVQRQRLAKFDRTLGVLDSIPLNAATWSQFLGQISGVAQKTKYIWITDAYREGTEKVMLKGYSLYRSKIPIFANSLGNARLLKVEVQEIREKTVYNFELEIMMKAKKSGRVKKKN